MQQVVQEIQYALAPAVMISACALLLLGLQNRFSNLANRFRSLNQERRTLTQKFPRESSETERLQNLVEQSARLLRRASQVKNSILMIQAAIGCFVITSLLLYSEGYLAVSLSTGVLGSFFCGLILIFGACLLMMAEFFVSYTVLKLEAKS